MAFFIQASGSPTRIGITKKKGTQTKRPFLGRYTYPILLVYSCTIWMLIDCDYQAKVGRCSSRIVTNSQRALS